MKRKPHSPLFWILLIVAQLITTVALIVVGAMIDAEIFNIQDAETLGHGVPFLTILLPMISLFILIILIILGIIGILRWIIWKRTGSETITGMGNGHPQDRRVQDEPARDWQTGPTAGWQDHASGNDWSLDPSSSFESPGKKRHQSKGFDVR
ncbi:MAG: hypothetical protein IJM69_06385 [Firmicutes bacterium]|nr:hypothetical protein [Bacillota bacterium]